MILLLEYRTSEICFTAVGVVYRDGGKVNIQRFVKPESVKEEIWNLIKDKEEEKMKTSLKYIDNHLLDTPTVAMMQVKREIINMMHLSYDNLRLGYRRILYQDNSQDKELIETEDKIDYINNAITQFLINLTHNVSLKDEKTLGSFFHVVNDIERIGDHAYNFYESSLKMVDNDLSISVILSSWSLR